MTDMPVPARSWETSQLPAADAAGLKEHQHMHSVH